jgi:hypothetical protein
VSPELVERRGAVLEHRLQVLRGTAKLGFSSSDHRRDPTTSPYRLNSGPPLGHGIGADLQHRQLVAGDPDRADQAVGTV